jgi:ribosomal protein S18 acetylase RimI-like enzyme
LQIRLAKLSDDQCIADFNQAMALETEDKHLPDKVILAGVRRQLADASLGFYLIAEDAGKTQGCLGITFEWSDWRCGLFWWIQSVYVDPEHRSRGVFSSLYTEVKKRASQRDDVIGIRLYAEKENTRAIRTYLRLGMTETPYRLLEEAFTDMEDPK